MAPRNRILLLIVIMTVIVLIVESIAVGLLYHTAFVEERSRLVEIAKSQARLIEAIARFYQKYNDNDAQKTLEATLTQIKDAHSHYRGFGKTGEFTLSKKENNQIVFLLNHRHYDLQNPKPVPWNSKLAQPMRLALSGKSGTVVALDYRGEKVLAAYEPLQDLNLGIVAKIDLSEVRAPFLYVIVLSGLIAVLAILVGTQIFMKITNPIIAELLANVTKLQKALSEVKNLQGILPICSFCKKIRDDQGYWDQVEVYVRNRTDADFSHGICPECFKKHYPEIPLSDDD